MLKDIEEKLDIAYENYVEEKITTLEIKRRVLFAEIEQLEIRADDLADQIRDFDSNNPRLKTEFYRERADQRIESRAHQAVTGVKYIQN